MPRAHTGPPTELIRATGPAFPVHGINEAINVRPVAVPYRQFSSDPPFVRDLRSVLADHLSSKIVKDAAGRDDGRRRGPGSNRPTAVLFLRMSSSEKKFGCVSCGDELHPERAAKYNYCLKPECQAKNLKGLTMVAVGVNKSAEQYLLLDEDTQAELAAGKYHDQRRGTFGQPEPAPGPPRTASPAEPTPAGPATASPATASTAGTSTATASTATASPATASTAGTSAARVTQSPPGRHGCRARRHSAGWRSCTTSRGCGRTRSPASWG